MSAKHFVAKTETIEHPKEETAGQAVDKVATSRRFFKGVSSRILAVKRSRQQLEAEILALQATNRRLLHENTHDDLTGALNRKALLLKIGERIKEGKPFGVIFLDMNAFKAINDKFSHSKGDEVLIGFSEYMRSCFRRDGEAVSHERNFKQADDDELPLGRLGGDEFGIVVNLSDRGRADGLTVEQRMEAAETYTRDVIQDFVTTQDESVRALDFGISQGGAIWHPEAPISTSELLHQADEAMYQDKTANGRPTR